MFSILTSKLFGGFAAVLLLITGVQSVRLHFAHNTIERRDETIKGLRADIELYKVNEAVLRTEISRQNAAVEASEAKGAQSRARAAKALRDAQRANSRADEAIGRIREREEVDCETGSEIMGGGL